MSIVGCTLAQGGVLSDDQRNSFEAYGCLLVEQFVPEPFLVGLQKLLETLVDERIATWQDAALISESYSDMAFGRRYYRAWLAAGRPANTATTDDGRFSSRARSDFIMQEWLVRLAAEVVGAERVKALDSCFYRAKFPGDVSTSLPWHQDAQCLEPISGVEFVTAWIPLVDVSEHNSCLQVSPIDHEKLFQPTWSDRSGYVRMRECDTEGLTGVQTIRMRRGDVFLLSPYLPHRSLDNRGAQTRWSVDFRYSPD